jgi:adenine-specific DNA-methyltransferase
MSKYDDLVRKLKEIFQINRPELDFGIYRILNARVEEINDYLGNGLKAKISESLAASGSSNIAAVQRELKEKEAQYRTDGIDPDTVPKIKELRQKLADLGSGSAEHENSVFTHLLTFFSRYYDKGDFISQRRFKGDTYAIPYSGEEVVLHWANKDQYYTKSGENFSNYGFKLDDGRTIRFRLVAADTAKDNRKDNDKERQFVLIDRHTRTLVDESGEEYEQEFLPVEEVGNELVIRFEYQAMPKGSKQDVLVCKAVEAILADTAVKARWLDLSRREPTEKNPQRTLLEKCLTSYTTKNSADYFIHKDLGGFLHRELDFYIKNEVMHLDDVQDAEKFADIEKSLRLIQTLRAIALDLITFLAQLEDFQKRLWLKKKFVVSADYCVTLDRIPEVLYSTIAANQKQWEQWEYLGVLDGKKPDLFAQADTKSVDYLKDNLYLMVDTSLFHPTFKFSLLSEINNLDDELGGVFVHGDNFQALNLLHEKYNGRVNTIYIDPPYNTDAGPISYKNGYRSSSWISMMSDRLSLSKNFLTNDGVLCATIDDYQQKELHYLLAESFGSDRIAGTVSIRINPSGRPVPSGFAQAHEYAIFATMSESSGIKKLERTPAQMQRYKESDKDGSYMWELFRKRGSNSERHARPSLYYPIYAKGDFLRVPDMNWNESARVWNVLEEPKSDEVIFYPIDDFGTERTWRWKPESIKDDPTQFCVKNRDGKLVVYYKFRPSSDGVLPLTFWGDAKYSATEHGTGTLKNLFAGPLPFSYPKSIHAVEDCISISGMTNNESICLDYFAGSATTAHAVLNLNRSSNGNRKYIIVEQGEYFDTVTKPRVQKVVYSAEWREGKPTAPHTGLSHAFKVIKIESYEDTLNNLHLNRSQTQQSLLNSMPDTAKEDYLLRYMLDVESRGSLLSVDQFKKPFDCKLKVTMDSAGSYEDRTIDLVETFNYLIGLRVKHVDMQIGLGFVTVTGVLPSGEKALVLWRNVEVLDYEKLNRLCDMLAINPADSEFDVVYINGDHNIPAVFTSTEAEGGITKTMKIRQIEPEFMARMFSTVA